MTDQDDQRTWRPPAAHRPDPGLPEARDRTTDDTAPTDSEGWQRTGPTWHPKTETSAQEDALGLVDQPPHGAQCVGCREGWADDHPLTLDDHLDLDLRRRGNLGGALDAAVEVTLDVPDISALIPPIPEQVIQGRFTIQDDYAVDRLHAAHGEALRRILQRAPGGAFGAFVEDRRREPPAPPTSRQALARIIRRTKPARWLQEQRHRLCCDDCETRLDWDERWSGR